MIIKKLWSMFPRYRRQSWGDIYEELRLVLGPILILFIVGAVMFFIAPFFIGGGPEMASKGIGAIGGDFGVGVLCSLVIAAMIILALIGRPEDWDY